MNWPFGDLRPFSFDCIAADNPWDFSLYSEAGAEKSASAHYETMSLDDITALPVGHLASDNCLLLMWGCEWMPPSDRQKVMESWGFTYKSTIIWRKVTRNGKVRMGTGYRARSMHEPVHIGTIGNPIHKAFPSIFDGIAREHSRKPESFFQMVERHMPQARKLDLFSRQSRPNWSSFGFETTKFDAGAPAKMKRDRPAPEPSKIEPMALFPDAA